MKLYITEGLEQGFYQKSHHVKCGCFLSSDSSGNVENCGAITVMSYSKFYM